MNIEWHLSRESPRRLQMVQEALEGAGGMLAWAKRSIDAATRGDPGAIVRYSRHFGGRSLEHMQTVRRTLAAMSARLTGPDRPVKLFHVLDHADFEALRFGALPVGVDPTRVAAFVCAPPAIPASIPLHLYLCPTFFADDRPGEELRQGQWRAGIILHELSHGAGGAVDHLLDDDPGCVGLDEDRRVGHADSYSSYCLSFHRMLIETRPRFNSCACDGPDARTIRRTPGTGRLSDSSLT